MDQRGNARAGQRPYDCRDIPSRGKRGAMTHEPVAGRARQHCAPYAFSRRVSHMEQRHRQMGHADMDSWEPSSIEPGAFPSVGSAIEYPEVPLPHRDHYKDPATRHVRVPNMTAVDSRADCESAARAHGRRAVPVPTPVRSMVSMAIQTNRQSILRHHMENGGSPCSSDGEEKENAPVQRRILQDGMSAMNSAGTAITEKSSKGGFDIKQLSYPAKEVFHMSVTSEKVLEDTRLGLDRNGMASKALVCAMHDEFDDLDHAWRIENAGEPMTNEGRVAGCLKKIAKRAQKASELKSLNSTKVPWNPSAFAAQGGTEAELQRRCSEVQAQLGATDKRVAELKEALRRPVPPQDSGVQKVLMELAGRLSTSLSGLEDAAAVLGAPQVTDNLDSSLQGLVAVEACCRQRLLQLQEEHQSLQDRNREFCTAATAGQQVQASDGGAKSILRAIR